MILMIANTHCFFFYKHTLLWAEPGKEIEITTNKLTKMCLKYGRFSAWRAYKLRAYKTRLYSRQHQSRTLGRGIDGSYTCFFL